MEEYTENKRSACLIVRNIWFDFDSSARGASLPCETPPRAAPSPSCRNCCLTPLWRQHLKILLILFSMQYRPQDLSARPLSPALLHQRQHLTHRLPARCQRTVETSSMLMVDMAMCAKPAPCFVVLDFLFTERCLCGVKATSPQ